MYEHLVVVRKTMKLASDSNAFLDDVTELKPQNPSATLKYTLPICIES